MGKGGDCSIICTQPRRIAAMGVADRVAVERCEKLGDVVGYRVRMDNKIDRQRTRMEFCTTGILVSLQENLKSSSLSPVLLPFFCTALPVSSSTKRPY